MNRLLIKRNCMTKENHFFFFWMKKTKTKTTAGKRCWSDLKSKYRTHSYTYTYTYIQVLTHLPRNSNENCNIVMGFWLRFSACIGQFFFMKHWLHIRLASLHQLWLRVQCSWFFFCFFLYIYATFLMYFFILYFT